MRIVLEHEQPLLASRTGEERALGFERHERLQVVAHDPRQRQVRRGRDDVAEEAQRWDAEARHMLVLMNIELFTSLGQTALQQNHPGQARLAFERGVQYLRKIPGNSRYQQSLQILEAQLERANALVLQNSTLSEGSSELNEGLKQLEGEELWKKNPIYD